MIACRYLIIAKRGGWALATFGDDEIAAQRFFNALSITAQKKFTVWDNGPAHLRAA